MDKRTRVKESVARALDEVVDLDEQWSIGRGRVTSYVCRRVRADLEEEVTDETIVDALVLELRARDVEVTEVE